MKKSSLLATIGVAIIVLHNIFWMFAGKLKLWENDWYETFNMFLNAVLIICWILIGQFFYALYKKQR